MQLHTCLLTSVASAFLWLAVCTCVHTVNNYNNNYNIIFVYYGVLLSLQRVIENDGDSIKTVTVL